MSSLPKLDFLPLDMIGLTLVNSGTNRSQRGKSHLDKKGEMILFEDQHLKESKLTGHLVVFRRVILFSLQQQPLDADKWKAFRLFHLFYL